MEEALNSLFTAAVGTLPPEQPRKKRQYTVSERSRAASRQNLQKANQAPKELKYRNTPRRQAARLKGLQRAAEVLRQFDSLYYGLGFKRGNPVRLVAPQPGAGGREEGRV